MTDDVTTRAALAYLRDHESAGLGRLAEFVGIPSVSALPDHRADVAAAADFLATELSRSGYQNVTTHPTNGHPIVTADLFTAPAGAPTILVYGHFDVQPVEPLDEWVSPPWTMTERDGRLYGRGVTDDKGQLWAHLRAIEALLAAGDGRAPVNVRVVAEGEEEIGSPSIGPFITANPDLFAADLALVSDSPAYAENVPAIGYSLRGLCSVEVTLRTLAGDLHSGQFGGAVPNATVELATLITTFHDRDGKVAVAGFYDDMAPVADTELAALSELPFDQDGWLRQAGAAALVGERGYGPLELTWTRPTLEINGVYGGHTGAGGKTIVPAEATAKISCRLVPGMRPGPTLDRVRGHIERHLPPYVTATVTTLGGAGDPYYIEPTGPTFDLATAALETSFQARAWLIRDGGSIPIVPILATGADLPVLLLGFGCPNENKHAPNEWLPLRHYRLGQETLVRFLTRLGATWGQKGQTP